MSSIANHDTVMESIFNYMKKTNIPNIDKRSNEVFKNSVVDKYWFDKINNYFKSLDLDACCYKTYSNKINWKSRYINIEDSELKKFEGWRNQILLDINSTIKQHSSEKLIFAMDSKYFDFPELWVQDNGYQKIDFEREKVLCMHDYDKHLIFNFNSWIRIWSDTPWDDWNLMKKLIL